MPDQEKFTGIWIPKEVWKDKQLSFMQRGLLAELFHLQDPEREGWAYPGNKYLGDIFGVSPNWISKNISDLVKLNYVTTKQNDRGRFVRVLKYGGSTIQWVGQSALVNPPMGIGQSANPPLVNPPTGEYSKTRVKEDTASRSEQKALIGEFCTLFTEKTGQKSVVRNHDWIQAALLLRVLGLDTCTRALKAYFGKDTWFNKDSKSFGNFVRHINDVLSSLPKEKKPPKQFDMAHYEATGELREISK